ncbi:MAG: DUF711 family protein, partial [Chloroflexota bacterium]
MKIRAITGFLDPGWPLEPARIESIAGCLTAIRRALTEAGYEIQTLRLATPPPLQIDRPVPPRDRPALARQLEAECFLHGIDYANIGPALPEEPNGFAAVPDVLAAAESVFCSGLYASPAVGLSLSAARACAQAIQSASTVSPDGFANLRFAGLANVPPGSPFFPAAYHDGGPPAVALATEAADLAVESLQGATSLANIRRELVGKIETHATALAHAAEPIATQRNLRFLGIDFSLAPFPEPDRSLGTALEALGAPAVGLSGTTAAAAFLADCLDQAHFPRTGFCGLMLPVLEDSILAMRAAEGQLDLTDLLLVSTVCGAGLDTIPLPGDTSAESIAALLIDLGALALRHNKPLTARLMPIPGKSAGDEIHFDFPYFADSRVMALPAKPLTDLLASSSMLDLGGRPR